MNKKFYQRGSSTAITVGIIGVLVVIIGVAFLLSRRSSTPATNTNVPAIPRATSAANNVPRQSVAQAIIPGTVLAGTNSPLLEFTREGFNAAVASGKLITLYYYANWCPICQAEFPLMQAAFNELTTDQVIGFRVNFNDSDTTPEEEALAREYGVAYQHTKVFLRGRTQVLKSPESWSKERYLSEINALAASR